MIGDGAFALKKLVRYVTGSQFISLHANNLLTFQTCCSRIAAAKRQWKSEYWWFCRAGIDKADSFILSVVWQQSITFLCFQSTCGLECAIWAVGMLGVCVNVTSPLVSRAFVTRIGRRTVEVTEEIASQIETCGISAWSENLRLSFVLLKHTGCSTWNVTISNLSKFFWSLQNADTLAY